MIDNMWLAIYVSRFPGINTAETARDLAYSSATHLCYLQYHPRNLFIKRRTSTPNSALLLYDISNEQK